MVTKQYSKYLLQLVLEIEKGIMKQHENIIAIHITKNVQKIMSNTFFYKHLNFS